MKVSGYDSNVLSLTPTGQIFIFDSYRKLLSPPSIVFYPLCMLRLYGDEQSGDNKNIIKSIRTRYTKLLIVKVQVRSKMKDRQWSPVLMDGSVWLTDGAMTEHYRPDHFFLNITDVQPWCAHRCGNLSIYTVHLTCYPVLGFLNTARNIPLPSAYQIALLSGKRQSSYTSDLSLQRKSDRKLKNVSNQNWWSASKYPSIHFRQVASSLQGSYFTDK